MAAPYPPLNKVTGVTIDYSALLQRATGGMEEPWQVYQFGGDRKTFWSNFQSEGIYGKPIDICHDGSIVHLPDPDLE